MQYLDGTACRVIDFVASEHNVDVCTRKDKSHQKVIALEGPKTYKYDVIGMASIHAYTRIASPPLLSTISTSWGKRMDPSIGNPRDQVLSLLSSLMVNATASGVSPRAGAQTGGNSITAQVRLTQIQVVSCLPPEPSR